MKMERRARKKTAYSGKEKRQSTNGRIKFQELQKRFPLDYINKSTYHMEFILLPENRFRKVLMDLQKKNHISEELARQVYYASDILPRLKAWASLN